MPLTRPLTAPLLRSPLRSVFDVRGAGGGSGPRDPDVVTNAGRAVTNDGDTVTYSLVRNAGEIVTAAGTPVTQGP